MKPPKAPTAAAPASVARPTPKPIQKLRLAGVRCGSAFGAADCAEALGGSCRPAAGAAPGGSLTPSLAPGGSLRLPLPDPGGVDRPPDAPGGSLRPPEAPGGSCTLPGGSATPPLPWLTRATGSSTGAVAAP